MPALDPLGLTSLKAPSAVPSGLISALFERPENMRLGLSQDLQRVKE
jgi:hypothetical protein